MRNQRSTWITPREAEILRLIASGLVDKEIAGRLGISGRTVGTHMERLFRRLNVHSRAQALAWYFRTDRVEGSSDGGAASLNPNTVYLGISAASGGDRVG